MLLPHLNHTDLTVTWINMRQRSVQNYDTSRSSPQECTDCSEMVPKIVLTDCRFIPFAYFTTFFSIASFWGYLVSYFSDSNAPRYDHQTYINIYVKGNSSRNFKCFLLGYNRKNTRATSDKTNGFNVHRCLFIIIVSSIIIITIYDYYNL